MRLPPGPHRVKLASPDGAVLVDRFVDVPTHACTLRDRPELSCYETP
jgi:hypothetical protein